MKLNQPIFVVTSSIDMLTIVSVQTITVSLTPALTELRAIMLHYRRAITLAHRGAYWILVENATRSLLNAITCLRGCVGRSELIGALYGEGLAPLYCAVNALYDVLLHSGVGWGTLAVRGDLVRRTVLLAVHVLYVHQHWEKVVSTIVKFNDITK